MALYSLYLRGQQYYSISLIERASHGIDQLLLRKCDEPVSGCCSTVGDVPDLAEAETEATLDYLNGNGQLNFADSGLLGGAANAGHQGAVAVPLLRDRTRKMQLLEQQSTVRPNDAAILLKFSTTRNMFFHGTHICFVDLCAGTQGNAMQFGHIRVHAYNWFANEAKQNVELRS